MLKRKATEQHLLLTIYLANKTKVAVSPKILELEL